MNIVMFTNTYTPHVGGVARSVQAFTKRYRAEGHQVLIVAPEFADMPENEQQVLRIPAIQRFNHSDFSVVLPVSGLLSKVLDEFQPDLVHAHHPYLLGMTALRVARFRNLPLVFTHHTLYEKYTHYLRGDSRLMRQFAIELATQYANLASAVFAPSDSLRQLMTMRGVESPIHVVPTGVNAEHYKHGNGQRFRALHGIADDSFVIGHVGRLAAEKNLQFLSGSVAECITRSPDSPEVHFLVLGTGPEESTIRRMFADVGISKRLQIHGVLPPNQLADAYHAMNVFAFASTSETQGMVLTEAMASGVPVVALDGPGVREVVCDQVNGRLLQRADVNVFAKALTWVRQRDREQYQSLVNAALTTASDFSEQHCASMALQHYQQLVSEKTQHSNEKMAKWEHLLSLIKAEWDILESFAEGAIRAWSPRNTSSS